MKILGLFFLLFNLFVFSFSRKLLSKSGFHDETVLLKLKSSFSDPNGDLSSWVSDSSSNHCSWYGISCNSDLRVVSLILRGCDDREEGSGSGLHFPDLSSCTSRRLGGEISPLVGDLSEFRVLSLAFNDLRGQIPKKIWELEKLEVLDLQGNSFIGEIGDLNGGLLKSADDNKPGLWISRFPADLLKTTESGGFSGFSSNVLFRKLLSVDGDEDVGPSSADDPPGKPGLYRLRLLRLCQLQSSSLCF